MNPNLAAVWPGRRLMPLGLGAPDASVRSMLTSLTAESIAPNARDPELARACLAGLWLGHDFLDESHAISQELTGPEGAYWHGLMHRREPDYWNSKYWMRRAGVHPIHSDLIEAVRTLNMPTDVDRLTTRTKWDACEFVDLCERAATGGGALEAFCREAQRIEWNLLFDYCVAKERDLGTTHSRQDSD